MWAGARLRAAKDAGRKRTRDSSPPISQEAINEIRSLGLPALDMRAYSEMLRAAIHIQTMARGYIVRQRIDPATAKFCECPGHDTARGA